MDGTDTTIEGPVSFVVTREIKPEAAGAYEEWLSEVGKTARTIDPNLGMTVIRPGGSQRNQYIVVLHFSSHEALDEWERCDTRKKLRKKLEPMELGKASFKEVTGFEYWFSLPKIAATSPPARYKMALITILGLYILSISYTYTVNNWLESLPDHIGLVLRIVVLVLLMTFVLMPILSRVFARWLYPLSARSAGKDQCRVS